MKTVRLIIKGKVQGVFFRASAKEVADELGIKGTVCNLPDESVEIIATGNETQLYQFMEWTKKGPPSAEVENVLTEELPTKEFHDFSIVRYRR